MSFKSKSLLKGIFTYGFLLSTKLYKYKYIIIIITKSVFGKWTSGTIPFQYWGLNK